MSVAELKLAAWAISEQMLIVYIIHNIQSQKTNWYMEEYSISLWKASNEK